MSEIDEQRKGALDTVRSICAKADSSLVPKNNK